MTAMTPEERAKAIVEAWADGQELYLSLSDPLVDFIASAIRDAENAKLEEASVAIETNSQLIELVGTMVGETRSQPALAQEAVEKVLAAFASFPRALKSKE